MINDYTVLVKYKNKKMQEIGQSIYPFNVYTDMLSSELKNCLGDIENMLHEALGQDVDLKSNESFMNVRRHILNAANGVARLPDSTYFKGTPIKAINASDFVANLIN